MTNYPDGFNERDLDRYFGEEEDEDEDEDWDDEYDEETGRWREAETGIIHY